jgi:serine/threonine protein kinase/tetratricopeptide (TPR) repeat protein
MSSATLETLKEIFHSARELSPTERHAYLTRACGSNEQLRREVEALLESDHAADDFIADPPARLVADAFGGGVTDPSDAGRLIGHYKLLECIGSGGMGAVYLAERADQQFQMQVAIKLIKRGMDTDHVLRRFQHERQILASLEHPNIARLLDGGTTDDGVPYFVMEHVEGQRIDRYAEEHQLSIDERLELFRQVCGAVSYAHQRLVVHRDLKPSNILVTPAGVPKLLDFGIAKIIQPNDSTDPLPTITVFPIMTPEYASPEQIEGAPATTLSDVYSLGAVLYELLAGRPPYRLQNRSPQEIEKAISTGQIEKPSAVVSHPEEARQLRGDLDNIVRMAMRKETARRYRSVEQFSEDIRRHLAGRTVVAQPDTLSYRASKFLGRNRLAVSAAVLLFLTLVGGIVATAWQARRATIQEQRARAEQARAERRFNDVRKLANNVLFDYHDAIRDLPGATKVRERLVKDALDYLDSLADEAQGDPELQRELAAAYVRVGDVRGGEGSGSLGDSRGAIESYTKALRIREALVAADPSDTQARRDLAKSHQGLGIVQLYTSERSQGVEHLQQALALCLDLAREQPANEDLQSELASAHIKLGTAMSDDGRPANGLEHLRAALVIAEKQADSDPRNLRYRRRLWSTHSSIASAQYLNNDVAGAIEASDKELALANALVADDPVNAVYRRILATAYQHSGEYRKRSDKRGGLEYLRKAAALREEMLSADPANEAIRWELAHTHKMMADFLVGLEDTSQALLHFSAALENYQKWVAATPPDLFAPFLVAICHGGVARMRARLGEVGLALEECGKASAILQGITADEPGHLARGEAYEYLGHAYAALAASPNVSASESRQHMSAARDLFRKSLKILDDARSRQGDLGINEEWAKEIAAEIAKCDTALR